MPDGDIHRELTKRIIGAAIEVHRELGPGLLESAYERALARELELAEMEFTSQVSVPMEYKGVDLGSGYRIDLLVEDEVIVEIKAVERLLPVHEAQLLSYLRLLNKPVGLLINFHVPVLKQGVVRRALTRRTRPTN